MALEVKYLILVNQKHLIQDADVVKAYEKRQKEMNPVLQKTHRTLPKAWQKKTSIKTKKKSTVKSLFRKKKPVTKKVYKAKPKQFSPQIHQSPNDLFEDMF